MSNLSCFSVGVNFEVSSRMMLWPHSSNSPIRLRRLMMNWESIWRPPLWASISSTARIAFMTTMGFASLVRSMSFLMKSVFLNSFLEFLCILMQAMMAVFFT